MTKLRWPANWPTDESVPTRWTLLERLQRQGDDGSWREFFETYWRLIYGFACKAGLSDAEAQDVVQETVIGVQRDLPQFEAHPKAGKFRAWLFQRVRWRVVDQLRKRGPRAVTLPASARAAGPLDARDQADLEADASAPTHEVAAAELERAWDEEWQQHRLTTALSRLRQKVRPQHFQAFDLYVLKGRPVAEVARRTKLAQATVYVVKLRLSQMLKRELLQVKD
jgi:RNA polymerase sigma-70 factor (ECF subfamily)